MSITGFVKTIVEPDWVERGALVGTVAGDAGEMIVAVANYIRLRDPTSAEAAFTVADDVQGRGVGTRLLEQLAARAWPQASSSSWRKCWPRTSPCSTFTGTGFKLLRELDRGEIEVRFPIAPTDDFRSRVEKRDHVAVAASLRPFFEPTSVAIVGASSRRGSIGGELFRNVLAAEFTGTTYRVGCPSTSRRAGVRTLTEELVKARFSSAR